MIEVICQEGKHFCISKIYAYDYGQKLRIWGLQLPHIVEAHFNRHGSNETVLSAGTSEKGVSVIPVPDSMLEKPGSFECIIFFRNPEAGESEYMMRFEVLRRSTLPTSTTEPSEEEINYFDSVLARMEEMLAQIGDAVQTAIDNLEIDAVPIIGSDNLVKSGGVYGAIDALSNKVDPYKVTFTGVYDDETHQYSWSCDRTYAEICEAIADGKYVYAYNSTLGSYLLLKKCDGTSVDFGFVQVSNMVSGDNIANIYCSVLYDGTVNVITDILQVATSSALSQLEQRVQKKSMVSSLDDTILTSEMIVDAIGIPVFVSTDNLTDYANYALTDSGWYIFARVSAKEGTTVTSETTIVGAAGYIISNGTNYVDVAIKFDEAATSRKVTINWGDYTDVIVFRAVDLATRNLDYRSTFYLYPLNDPIHNFITWSYAKTTDTTFQSGKNYFTKSGDNYTLAEVTANAAVPPSYYEQSISYALTADETFQDGKTYYVESEGEYAAAEVTTGEAVTPETYYEQSISYALTTDTEFQDGKTYYTLASNVYSEASVTAGDPIVVYYNHSKLIISGMTRNLTYELEDIVDCPTEVILPTITDGDNYGCWYDFQFRHAGTYSISFTLPEGVKFATNNTPNPTVGMNLMHVFYTDIGGAKVWGAMNTHVDFTA